MNTTHPFLGIEAEGPDQSILTLFIPNHSIKEKDIPKLLQIIEEKNCRRVYFGAGNHPGLDDNCVELTEQLYLRTDCKIIVEITLQDLPQFEKVSATDNLFEIVLVLHTSLRPQHIKFIGAESLVWHDLQEPYITLLDDDLYNTDKILDI